MMRILKFSAAVCALSLLCSAPMPGYGESRPLKRDIVTVIDRTDIEMSGLVTVSELVSGRSIFNDYGTGQASFGTDAFEVMINGRLVSGIDLSALPLSVVERIEILDRGVVAHGGGAISGTINVVLRNGHEGGEVSIGVARPDQKGGDADNGSAVWSGTLGQGRYLVGFGSLAREEVRDADRDFSRASWTAGGSFGDARGVSIQGNTVLVPNAGFRSVGDCDEDVYTGILTFPDGNVCGYAFADVKWLLGYEDYSRDSVLLALEHPLENDASLYLEARAAQGDSFFVYAPATGNFEIEPEASVRQRLFDAVDDLQDNFDPGDGTVEVYHRFVANGNREWDTDLDESDIAFGIRSDSRGGGIGYDVHVEHYRHKQVEKGANFVSESLAIARIESGAYDIVNPVAPADPDTHNEAVRDMTLRMNHVTVSENTKFSALFDGLASGISGSGIQWTAGLEFEETDWSNIYDYRNPDNGAHEPSDVIGSAGASSVGERSRTSAIVELSFPVLPAWEMSLGARIDDYDDVGETSSLRVANRYRLDDNLELRASWDKGEAPPSLSGMHEEEGLTYPAVCDPASDSVCRQVEMVIGGNPGLGPDTRERIRIGATAKAGDFTLDLDWFSVEISDQAGAVSPQAVVNEHHAGRPLAGSEVLREGGQIVQIVNPTLQAKETEARGVSLHANRKWEASWADLSVDVYALRTTHSESRVLGVKDPGDYPRNRFHAISSATRGDVTASWGVHSVSGFWNKNRSGRYDGWTGHDIAIQWRDAFGHRGLDVTGGILNVGDKGPSTDPSSSTDPILTNDSVYGRTVFLTARLSW